MHLSRRIFPGLILLAMAMPLSAAPITGLTGPGGVGRTDGTTDLRLWLKADTIAPVADGTAVSTWTDSSGKTNTATAVGASSATYQGTGFNGNPTVRFDGTLNQSYNTANAINLTATQQESFFIAGYSSGALGDAALLGNTGSGNYTLRTRGTSSTGWNINGFTDGTTSVRNATPTITGAPAILSGVRSQAANFQTLWNRGSQLRTTTHTGPSAVNGAYQIGRRGANTEWFDGDMSEIIAFNTALTTPERRMVENYLSSKYGVSLTAGDRYTGDTLGYTADVFGIGAENGASITTSGSGGFGIESAGALADGTYVLAGHNVAAAGLTPVVTANDFTGDRWTQAWYVDNNGDAIAATLAFDFSDAGIAFDSGDSIALLFSSDGNLANLVSLGGPTSSSGDQFLFDLAALQNGAYTLGVNLQAPLTPEPASLLLFGMALAAGGFAVYRRRR